jgi:hypothetical protein
VTDWTTDYRSTSLGKWIADPLSLLCRWKVE